MKPQKKETTQALIWLSADRKRSPAEAATKFGICASTLSRAMRRELARGTCKTCGQLVYDAKILDTPLPRKKSGEIDMVKVNI